VPDRSSDKRYAFNCPGFPERVAHLDKECKRCKTRCFNWATMQSMWKEFCGDPDQRTDADYYSQPWTIHVTDTLGCIRRSALKRLVDYTEDPFALNPRWFGLAVHEKVEQANPPGDHLKKWWWACEFKLTPIALPMSWKLIGKVDYIMLKPNDPDYGIWDKKTMKQVRKYLDDSTTEQLSVYHEWGQRPIHYTTAEHDEVGPLWDKDFPLRVEHHAPNGGYLGQVELREGALERCLERAGMLIEVLMSDPFDFEAAKVLPPEGHEIYYGFGRHAKSACNWCPTALRETCEALDLED